MAENGKSWFADRVWLVLAGLVCFGGLALFGFKFIEWDLARCYVMPPREYRRQVDRIVQGMPLEEAIASIEGYTEIRRKEERSMVLVMLPFRKSWVLPAIPQWIRMELDESGAVARAHSGDG